MESVLYRGHRFLGDVKHFWMAVRMWKTTLFLEELARQKRTKMWPKRGLSWGLIDVWHNELNLNQWTVHDILTEEVGMQKKSAKLIPINFNNDQRKTEEMRAWTFLNTSKMAIFVFKHVITGEESWIFEYDPENKRQSSEWHTNNSPRPKKTRMSKSKIKSMLIRFFDSQGVVNKDFVPQGQTVNQQHYREVLERLRIRVHRVRPEIAATWMLHHDNAPCHTALSINEFFTKKGYSCGSAAPVLAWSASVCPLPFPETQIPPQSSSFWNCGQHPKCRWQTSWGHFHMKTSSTATGSGSNVSGGVWLPKGTTLKGIMLICSSAVKKNLRHQSHYFLDTPRIMCSLICRRAIIL